jgi:hypothetical protein
MANNQVMSGRSEGRDQFQKHLERASEVVRTWPVWKQTLLGGTLAGQEIASVSIEASASRTSEGQTISRSE